MAKKNSSERLLKKAEAALASGDDTGAKLAMSIGFFIVSSDLMYRIAQSKIEIAKPTAQGTWAEIKDLADIRNVTSAISNITELFNSVVPKLNIDLADKDQGMWDFRITCAGMGLLTGGMALYIANHPELITKSLDTVKDISVGAMNFAGATVNLATQGLQAGTDVLVGAGQTAVGTATK